MKVKFTGQVSIPDSVRTGVPSQLPWCRRLILEPNFFYPRNIWAGLSGAVQIYPRRRFVALTTI
jgi:hypothetical protein